MTDYSELSVAPWYGLAMCDPHSYPQNPCKPDSDSNLGAISNPKDAGSAFMEMQFYPPGNTPLIDGASCSKTQWCAALNIDSLECTFNFVSCNTELPGAGELRADPDQRRAGRPARAAEPGRRDVPRQRQDAQDEPR